MAHFARARQQELAVWADDARYVVLNRGAVRGTGYRVSELPALASSRWGRKVDAPFHVLYVGQPWNWEEHNLPADPGLAGVVSTWWLRDAGFVEYEGGLLRGRNKVGPALLDHVRKLDKERPIHLIIAYLSGGQILAEDVRKLHSAGVVTAAFHWDDRLYFRGRFTDGTWVGPAAVASAFDLNLTNVRRSLTKYAAVGGRALFWPEAANPGMFKPLGIERTHDVSFLGGCYGVRAEVVSRLEADGFSVLAHGPGWPLGPVTAEKVPEVLNRGKVVLGFSGIGRSMCITCLKGRDFEAPMCGAVYLTSENPELSLVFDVGKEIISWRNYRQLTRTLGGILAKEEKLTLMREAARRCALSRHTWAARVETLAILLGHPWRVGMHV